MTIFKSKSEIKFDEDYLVGLWNLGNTVISFSRNGTGFIESHGEKEYIDWRLKKDTGLLMDTLVIYYKKYQKGFFGGARQLINTYQYEFENMERLIIQPLGYYDIAKINYGENIQSSKYLLKRKRWQSQEYSIHRAIKRWCYAKICNIYLANPNRTKILDALFILAVIPFFLLILFVFFLIILFLKRRANNLGELYYMILSVSVAYLCIVGFYKELNEITKLFIEKISKKEQNKHSNK